LIRAIVFDLDGTLVQTEKLKAFSYARAIIELCPTEVSEEEVIETFKEVVGLPRREVAQALVQRFDLEETSRALMDDFGVSAPWQAFVQVRLRIYEEMLADPQVIRDNQWPHNMALLEQARETGCKTGLATMSRCQQATRVLEILKLTEAFDFIATRDDVTHGKPDPEIYQLVSHELQVPASECLVIEDSPSGIKAALAAGMHCIGVTTPFTRKGVHDSNLLEKSWIVDDPSELVPTVAQKMDQVERQPA
jgi:HAD superfamily hydrolase (TIGR01509 family)